MLEINTRTDYNGPLFDHRARRVFDDLRDELEEEAADFTLEHIQDTFHSHFKQPTGYYESRVTTRPTADGIIVWDGGWGGPVYGPWLEGVGSRNATTRFKGYRAFRKAANALERHIEDLGDRIFRLRYRHRL